MRFLRWTMGSQAVGLPPTREMVQKAKSKRSWRRKNWSGKREGRSVGLGVVSSPTWESVELVSQSCHS